ISKKVTQGRTITNGSVDRTRRGSLRDGIRLRQAYDATGSMGFTGKKGALVQYSITPLPCQTPSRIRGQPVRRSPSSIVPTARIGLASEARSKNMTLAKSEGRRRVRERDCLQAKSLTRRSLRISLGSS